MSRMFSLTLRSSRVENYHSVASRAPGSSSEAVWNAKIHFLTRGVLFFPHIITRVSTAEEINVWETELLYGLSTSNQAAASSACCHSTAGYWFWSHWSGEGEMSWKPEKLSQHKAERRASLPWHLHLPPHAGWWRPASPGLEQDILVGSVGWLFLFAF